MKTVKHSWTFWVFLAGITFFLLGVTYALEKTDTDIGKLFVGDAATEKILSYKEKYSMEEFIGLVIKGKRFDLPEVVPLTGKAVDEQAISEPETPPPSLETPPATPPEEQLATNLINELQAPLEE